jgi:hypothetical protein
MRSSKIAYVCLGILLDYIVLRPIHLMIKFSTGLILFLFGCAVGAGLPNVINKALEMLQ